MNLNTSKKDRSQGKLGNVNQITAYSIQNSCFQCIKSYANIDADIWPLKNSKFALGVCTCEIVRVC